MSGSTTKIIRVLLQILMVALVLAAGVGIFKKMMAMKKPPPKKDIIAMAPLVNARSVSCESMQMMVHGFGEVKEKVSAQIVPQVSGMVVGFHDEFVNGGFFKAGEPLITIDKRDYELQLESAQAAVAREQVVLDKENAEAQVALKEWQQIHPEATPSSPLVLREPQIRDAEAQLKSAMAKMATAKLNLERTVISMPFDGRIAQESIDLGQYLTPGQPVARVYGIDTVEIVVPIEDRELAWFDVPMNFNGNHSTHQGSEVTVRAKFAGKNHQWQGRVVRCEGQIDPASRMLNVVVEVPDPFKLTGDRPPLMPGMFVEVEIHGRQANNIIKVPRSAVRNSREIWVEKDGRLHVQPIEIVRSDTNYAYITSGIGDGDVVIISSLDAITEGMGIRINVPDKEEVKGIDKKN
ncbi:MAG: efflux RND transporter periplasmic adaptor subunit [Phycisphaerae bacterium]|nr:efflux RND transporter periplasmic adaptor subunit [Phycisphaerae bacterium]